MNSFQYRRREFCWDVRSSIPRQHFALSTRERSNGNLNVSIHALVTELPHNFPVSRATIPHRFPMKEATVIHRPILPAESVMISASAPAALPPAPHLPLLYSC